MVSVAETTPLPLIDRLLPILIPPNVDELAIGRVYEPVYVLPFCVKVPVKLIFPDTSSVYEGVDVPIPIVFVPFKFLITNALFTNVVLPELYHLIPKLALISVVLLVKIIFIPRLSLLVTRMCSLLLLL